MLWGDFKTRAELGLLEREFGNDSRIHGGPRMTLEAAKRVFSGRNASPCAPAQKLPAWGQTAPGPERLFQEFYGTLAWSEGVLDDAWRWPRAENRTLRTERYLLKARSEFNPSLEQPF